MDVPVTSQLAARPYYGNGSSSDDVKGTVAKNKSAICHPLPTFVFFWCAPFYKKRYTFSDKSLRFDKSFKRPVKISKSQSSFQDNGASGASGTRLLYLAMSPAAIKSIGGGEEKAWESGDDAIACTKPKPTPESRRCSDFSAEGAVFEKGASVDGNGSGDGVGEHGEKALSRGRRSAGASSIQHVEQRPAPNLTGSRSSGSDGHGFACVRHEPDLASHDEEASRCPGKDHDAKQFEVQWDGSDDPMDPKNLSKGRKWMVVLIVSAGSTCV